MNNVFMFQFPHVGKIQVNGFTKATKEEEFQFPHAGKIQGQDICPYHHYITRYGICQALFFLKTHYLYKKYIYAAFYLRGLPGKTEII